MTVFKPPYTMEELFKGPSQGLESFSNITDHKARIHSLGAYLHSKHGIDLDTMVALNKVLNKVGVMQFLQITTELKAMDAKNGKLFNQYRAFKKKIDKEDFVRNTRLGKFTVYNDYIATLSTIDAYKAPIYKIMLSVWEEFQIESGVSPQILYCGENVKSEDIISSIDTELKAENVRVVDFNPTAVCIAIQEDTSILKGVAAITHGLAPQIGITKEYMVACTDYGEGIIGTSINDNIKKISDFGEKQNILMEVDHSVSPVLISPCKVFCKSVYDPYELWNPSDFKKEYLTALGLDDRIFTGTLETFMEWLVEVCVNHTQDRPHFMSPSWIYDVYRMIEANNNAKITKYSMVPNKLTVEFMNEHVKHLVFRMVPYIGKLVVYWVPGATKMTLTNYSFYIGLNKYLYCAWCVSRALTRISKSAWYAKVCKNLFTKDAVEIVTQATVWYDVTIKRSRRPDEYGYILKHPNWINVVRKLKPVNDVFSLDLEYKVQIDDKEIKYMSVDDIKNKQKVAVLSKDANRHSSYSDIFKDDIYVSYGGKVKKEFKEVVEEKVEIKPSDKNDSVVLDKIDKDVKSSSVHDDSKSSDNVSSSTGESDSVSSEHDKRKKKVKKRSSSSDKRNSKKKKKSSETSKKHSKRSDRNKKKVARKKDRDDKKCELQKVEEKQVNNQSINIDNYDVYKKTNAATRLQLRRIMSGFGVNDTDAIDLIMGNNLDGMLDLLLKRGCDKSKIDDLYEAIRKADLFVIGPFVSVVGNGNVASDDSSDGIGWQKEQNSSTIRVEDIIDE